MDVPSNRCETHHGVTTSSHASTVPKSDVSEQTPIPCLCFPDYTQSDTTPKTAHASTTV